MVPRFWPSIGLWLLVVTLGVACAPAAPAPAPAPQVPLAAPALTPEEAKREGKLTFYSYLFTGDLGLAISNAFQDVYGIKVEHITGRGAELSARLKTEQRMGQIVGDVFQAASANVEIAKQLDLTLSAADLPVFKDTGVWSIDPFAMDREGHLVVLAASQYTPFVNTNLLKASEEPKSWRDLLDPKWRGKIIVQDPQTATMNYYVMLALMDNGVIDQDYLKELGRQLIMASSPQDALMRLARGEVPISLWSSDTSGSTMIAEGAPIKPIAMQEGIVAGGTPLALIKGAPHPNAARLFVNWLLSRDGLTVYAQISKTQAIRKDVLDFRHEAAKIKSAKVFIITSEQNKRAADLFRQRTLVDLWKQ